MQETATAAGLSHEITDLERQTMARVARRLLPLLIACYFIAYLDRVNVGFASLTMNKALGFSRGRLWLRRRHLLPRLLHLRSAQQHPAEQGRRTDVDRADPDHLGHHLRLHCVHRRPAVVLLRPLPAGHRRGRLLSRHHPVSDLVVPVVLPLAHRRRVHGGDPAVQHPGFAGLRRAARSRRLARHRRLAMAVHPGGRAGGRPGRGLLALHDRLAVGGALAGAGTARLADRPAGRGKDAPRGRSAATA